MNIRVENEVPMSAQELWRIMHTSEFDAFAAREYELMAYKELEKEVSDNLIHRRLRVITRTGLSYIPMGIAHKIIGDNAIIYEEIQDIYKDRYEMHWENKWIEPPAFKDKIQVSGWLRLIPIDEGRCKRIREMSVHIRIFGVGRLLEGMVVEQAKKTSEKFSQVVAKWKSENARFRTS
jgi:hypothetical protein